MNSMLCWLSFVCLISLFYLIILILVFMLIFVRLVCSSLVLIFGFGFSMLLVGCV